MRNNILYALASILCGIILFQSCVSEEDINYKQYYVNGKRLYEKHCQNCHGSRGEGLGTLYPPLTDTTYLIQNKDILACIIKDGQNENIRINNVPYQGQMPANSSLAAIDIAQVIVYITNSFGNNQGYYDVSEANADILKCN